MFIVCDVYSILFKKINATTKYLSIRVLDKYIHLFWVSSSENKMQISSANIDGCVKYICQSLNRTKSEQKQKCLCCCTTQTTTWRPSLLGKRTLCNSCGLKYISSAKRERTLDVIIVKDRPVWIKKKKSKWTIDTQVKDSLATTAWLKDEKMRQRLQRQFQNANAI